MNTTFLQTLIDILLAALRQPDRRKELISEFQQKVWKDSQTLPNAGELEVLRDLAYDLDFYEPDVKLRAEDTSLFGDERAEEEIRAALNKLGRAKKALRF